MAFALATFNVKNLFEPRSEAERVLIAQKVDRVAEMLRACDADVIGLQEVGSPELLSALIGKLSGRPYAAPLVGTPDERGIRCALLSRVPILNAHVDTARALSFPVFQVGDAAPFGSRIPLRRGVPRACVAAPGLGPVHVMVVHFKSARPVPLRDESGAEVEPVSARARAEGSLRSLVWRSAEALHARKIVDDLLASEPHALVAAAGDFNDGPESLVVRILRGERQGELFDCTSKIEPGVRFSVLHKGLPTQIDHVFATANLTARVASARFLNAELRDHGLLDPGTAEPPTVDSDHAPLVVRFE